MSDKDGRERFFEKSFLLASIKPDTMLRMLFLTISNAEVDFQAWDLQWRSYTIGDILSTTRWVELIRKKEFAVAALDSEHKAFIVHIGALSIDSGDEVHPSRNTQITYLKADEALSKVPNKYADFIDIFSPKLAAELPEHTRIYNHVIKLMDDWQLLYGLIYSFGPMKLKILKTYIGNNLANGFIRSSKSSARVPILFN